MPEDSDATVSRVDVPVRRIGHYEVLGKLGAGGMGVVFKARDTKLDRLVALKLLPVTLESDPKAKDRLLREARAAAKLDHANICSVYSVEETEQGLCIVMQYLEGQSLKEIIEKGPCPFDSFYSVATQVTAGLEEAHSKGILHRDIKPGNIMLLPDGRAKLVDFGLAASSAAEATLSAGAAGTPAYMAPEVLGGQRGDERSDLFSVGVLFYEMITGKSPFPRESSASVISAILNKEAPPMEATRTGLPPGLEQVVKRLLVKDPQKRYASARELLENLEKLRDGGAKSPSAPPPNRTNTWIGVAAALILVAGIAALRPWSRTATSPPPAASPAPAKQAPTPPAAGGKPSVAALPFTSAQKDPKWAQFEQGLADGFADSFARDGRFRVVERSQLDKAMTELKLNASGAVDPATAQQVGKLIGAKYLVVGSFQIFEGVMRLSARMIRVETGEIVHAQTLSGPTKEALKLSDNAAQEFLRTVKEN